MKALSGRTRTWLERAAAWRLIGLLFERPCGDWEATVAAVASEVRDGDLRSAAQAAAGAQACDYLAVLGPGGAVSPREVAWRPREDPGWIVADVLAFHRAFGFAPQVEDPPDHVAVLASFAGYLCAKAAYLGEAGADEAAATVEAAFAKFVAEHVRRCAEPLAERLAAVAPSYLALAGGALVVRAGRVPAAERPLLQAIPIEPAPGGDGGTFDCGTCGGAS